MSQDCIGSFKLKWKKEGQKEKSERKVEGRKEGKMKRKENRRKSIFQGCKTEKSKVWYIYSH